MRSRSTESINLPSKRTTDGTFVTNIQMFIAKLREIERDISTDITTGCSLQLPKNRWVSKIAYFRISFYVKKLSQINLITSTVAPKRLDVLSNANNNENAVK